MFRIWHPRRFAQRYGKNNGSDDGPAEIVSHLPGVEVVEGFGFESGGKRILALHGDRFDSFIARYPIVSNAADCFDRILQKLDRNHHFARYAKRSGKTYLRNSAVIEALAIAYAPEHGYTSVCCGHTHLAVSRFGSVSFFNSSCWTERPYTFLAVADGEVVVRAIKEQVPENDYAEAS